MKSTIVNYLKAAVALLVLPVILGVDCPGEQKQKLAAECADPKPTTICTAVCKTRQGCESCCDKHPNYDQNDKNNCTNKCQSRPLQGYVPAGDDDTDPPEMETLNTTLVEEAYEQPCGCGEITAPRDSCEDAAYQAIVDLVPAYMVTEETMGALCALTPEERIELLENVETYLDGILGVSEERFNDEIVPWIDGHVQGLMANNGATGDDAYRFYYNHFTTVMWYEWMYYVEHEPRRVDKGDPLPNAGATGY